jgi:hypothetical protein
MIYTRSCAGKWLSLSLKSSTTNWSCHWRESWQQWRGDGVAVNTGELLRLKKETAGRIASLESEIYSLAETTLILTRPNSWPMCCLTN